MRIKNFIIDFVIFIIFYSFIVFMSVIIQFNCFPDNEIASAKNKLRTLTVVQTQKLYFRCIDGVKYIATENGHLGYHFSPKFNKQSKVELCNN